MNRSRELDSLRGLAALAVLAYHSLALNFPQLDAGIYLNPVKGLAANLAVYSPLHVVWLGAESVWFFFVLSGFVLTRSTMRPSFSLRSYYPSRLVRLYLPVVFAIALAWLSYLLPHQLRPGMDQGMATSYPLGAVLEDLTLLGGTSNSLGVLWSLQWEVLFSLLLPVYVLLGKRNPIVVGVLALGGCLVGTYINNPLLSYMPMFFAGVVLAQHWEFIRRGFVFLGSGRVWAHAVGVVLVLASVCGLTSFFLLGDSVTAAGLPARVVTLPIVMASIILLIVLAQSWPPLRAVLTLRPIVFLGTISFSLYLVHLPIVTAAIFILSPGPLAMIVGVVIALAMAVAFYFVIERPAHAISRRIASRLREEPAAPQPPGQLTSSDGAGNA